MNCQSFREFFPALLDQRTETNAHPEARAHLANCPECQREFAALSQTLAALDAMPPHQPSPRLRTHFYSMLEEEKHSAASAHAATAREYRARHARMWRWILSPAIGCALLIAGFYYGTRVVSPSTPASSSTDVTLRQEIKTLQKKVDTMGVIFAHQLLQQQQSPTNDRLREVLASANTDNPSDQVLSVLISALTIDQSANVRLRALEALFSHANKDIVRAGVLAALPREQNALVQLEMIDFVAAAHDPEATPVLERISQNEAIDISVRDAAKRALTQL